MVSPTKSGSRPRLPHIDPSTIYQNGLAAEDSGSKFRLFESAAKKGHLLAKLALGTCYMSGVGTPQNTESALKCYFEVAILDQNIASDVIKILKEYAFGYLTPKDSNEKQVAFKYYKMIADQGNQAAQLEVGIRYLNGDCGIKDTNVAMFYFQSLAEKDHPEANFILGGLYFHGIAKKDLKLSLSYYQKAAELGHLGAQDILTKDWLKFS